MRFKFALLGLLSLLAISTPASADRGDNNTTVTVNLQDLDDNTRNAVLSAIKPKGTPNISPDDAKKWAIYGKGIGEAIAATAKALNVGINDFIKTPAGTYVILALALYLFGAHLWAVVAGALIWLIVGVTIWRSFRKFHMPFVLKGKDGAQVLETYHWDSKDAKTMSACAHCAFFLALSIVCLVYIL